MPLLIDIMTLPAADADRQRPTRCGTAASPARTFFVNSRIRLRSRPHQTYLHELFHIWQPFKPGPDGRWIAEGLAEYYSLALPFRAGRMSARTFARGLALFDRYGRWDLDLSRTRIPAALNNSAPLVLHSIDQAVRRTTGGHRSLDDVVRLLAHARGDLTTASLLSAVNRTAGRDFTPLFRRHVPRHPPPVAEGRPRDRH
jgi:predicted metalloprotease with PDZ domain